MTSKNTVNMFRYMIYGFMQRIKITLILSKLRFRVILKSNNYIFYWSRKQMYFYL